MKPRRSGDTYTWQFRNLAAYYDEGYTPQNGEGRPTLCATTFASTADALSRIARTERDIVKVQGLARQSKDETLKAYAEYMGSYLGRSGVTPFMTGYRTRPAAEVLASAYGTDLEKCTLLARALTAEGIDAEVVAVYPACHAVKMLRDIKSFAVAVTIDGNTSYYSGSGAQLDLQLRSDRDEVYSVTDGRKIDFAPCANTRKADITVTINGTEATSSANVETAVAASPQRSRHHPQSV